jgi:hypothetical protein
VTSGDLEWLHGDPSCAYGPDGTAYFADLEIPPRETTNLYVYRSPDGGLSWEEPVEVPLSKGTDRPYILVDDRSSRYGGRVYVTGQTNYRSLSGSSRAPDITLFRSLDGGRTFDPPARLAPDDARSVFHPGNSVILDNGTLLGATVEIRHGLDDEGKPGPIRFDPARPNSKLYIVKSGDGGDSVVPAAVVSDVNVRWPPETISTFPSLAVDRGNGDFRNRLYVAWPDTRAGRTEIFFSWSGDLGKSWTKPKTINDDTAFEPPLSGPDNFMPVVAVNPQGVVGVMWYDRRNHPDNLGWDVRFAASLDGGDSFLPSVVVSEHPMSHEQENWPLRGYTVKGIPATGDPLSLKFWLEGFSFDGGHTAGMEADAKGFFHPLWIDNRTGTRQVWTAAVRVEGASVRNGSPSLSTLTDVSGKATLMLSNMTYNQKTGILTTDAQLRNLSEDTIRGPVKLRALRLQSGIAQKVEILNSDNGSMLAGAVWDLTGLLDNNQLKPGDTSKRRQLSFQLSGQRTPRPNGFLGVRPLSMDARILAAESVPTPPDAREGPTRAASKQKNQETTMEREKEQESDDDMPH